MSVYTYSRVIEESTGQEQGGAYTYRTRYAIRATSSSVTRTQILLSGALPFYGTLHPENASAVCVRANATRRSSTGLLWDGEAEWNTVTGNEDPNEKQKQPDLRRPQWHSEFVEVPQSLFVDYDGKRFCDKAGTDFSPPPEMVIEVQQVTVSRYQATFDRATDLAYLHATNTDEWQTAQPGEALLKNIVTDEVYEYGAYWFHRTYTIWVSPKIALAKTLAVTDKLETVYLGGFDPIYVLNAGPRHLVFNSILGKYEAVPAKRGNVADGQPVLLNDDGTMLPLGDDGHPTESQPPVHLTFRNVKRMPFAPLNLIPPWQ